MVCVPPLKLTVPVPALKVPWLVKEPETLRVLDPKLKLAPEPIVIFFILTDEAEITGLFVLEIQFPPCVLETTKILSVLVGRLVTVE